jgi:uncharacterized RDD family membrane protein YckC
LAPEPLLFTSAEDEGKLHLFWRVEKEDGRGLATGEVRWTTFDGAAFGEQAVFPHDLAAMAAGLDPEAPAGSRLRLYGVPYRAQDANIRLYVPRAGTFAEGTPVAYEREGLTGNAGVSRLTVGRVGAREFLFAQLGAVIRFTSREGAGAWSAWEDLDRRPAEQTAMVYLWFGSLLTLSGGLIVLGLASWRRRRRPRGEAKASAPEASPAALASIPERGTAFAVDLLLVAGACWGVTQLLPDLLPRASAEPGLKMALLAWAVVLLLGYFTLFEALFTRTPGKRLMGLEVQRVEGGRPGFLATLYRNAFRIELLLPPIHLMPLLSLLVMVMGPRRQRPGDLVARTVVCRTPGA